MRKTLLLMAVSLIAAGASAGNAERVVPSVLNKKVNVKMAAKQTVRPVVSKKAEGAVMMNEAMPKQRTASLRNNAPVMRAAAEGVYYARPEGTWWLTGQTQTGSNTYHVVPPFTEMTYINMSDEKANSVWTLGSSDLSKYVDENYNLKFKFDKTDLGYVSYSPNVAVGNLSYGIGNYTLTLDSVPQVAFPFNYTECPRYYGYASGESAFQSGDDVFDWDGDGTAETFKVGSLLQFFEKPAAPTLFYDIYIWSHTPNRKFDPSPVKLNIYKWDRDEEGYRQLGDLIKTLTLTSYEYDYDDPIETQQGAVEYVTTLVFSSETEDEFGTPTAEPFLIDSNYAIEMDLSGFEDSDLRLYFTNQGGYAEEMNTRATPTFIVGVDKKTGEELGSLSYYSTGQNTYCYNLAYMFDVLVDAIDVEEGTNEVIAPVEGGDTESQADDKTTWVWTNLPFFDTLEDGESAWSDNYDFEGLPDWLSPKIDPTYYEYETEQGSIRGLHLVWFEAEALPEGVNGREATINIVSTRFGFKSERSIHVVQGEVAKDDAIKQVNVENKSQKTYNVAGQQVSKDYKGLVVKDGKKMMVK